ncbi:MAG: hypothetical protein KGY80_13410, partial [Candidatus Thorarchaeota archaeon]|nr:hypothetical protein [Candidatus Thorarchaeota archaeon]
IIILYEKLQFSAYRTDRFEGFKNDILEGVPGYWTKYKVHLKDSLGGPFGGTFTRSTPLDVDTFNFMVSSSAYTNDVSQMLYDSLIKRHWNGKDIMWLAADYQIETHADNPSVPDGHTRITFDLLPNATWNDGEELTAEDVAFTMLFYHESPRNPLGIDLQNMTGAFALSKSRIAIEFNTESYWHLHSVGYKPIIPQHVFSDIEPSNWNEWSPEPPQDVMVTSGPFNVSEHVPGGYCVIQHNPNYFYSPRGIGPSISHPEDQHCDVLHAPMSISWHLYDIDLSEYQVALDGTVVMTGKLSKRNHVVNFSIRHLSPGIHNLTIVASDSKGSQTSDTVLIYVEGPIATLLVVASFGIIGVCMSIVIRVGYQEIREMRFPIKQESV